MTDIATLGIKIEARDIKNAVAELDRLENQSEKTEKATDGISNSYGKLKAALAAAGIVAITKQLLDQINTYTALTNKLKLVTDGTENLSEMQALLFETAQDTRASLEGTINLYSRLARSTKSLGISQEELVDVTETINRSIAVSGSTAQEAQAALFQLGQGLGAGALRGEELNSVLEQTPRLAQAIADGLGVSIAQLREMGAAGELNAEKVINALQSQSATIAAEFDQTEKTISQALTQIDNVILQTFGSLEGGDLVDALDEFRRTLEDPAIVEGLQSIASLLVLMAEGAVKAASGWGMIAKGASDALAQLKPNSKAILEEVEMLRERISDLRTDEANGESNWFSNWYFNKTTQERIQQAQDRIAELRAELKGMVDATGGTVGTVADSGAAANDSGSGIAEAKQAQLQLVTEANALALLKEQEFNEQQRLIEEENTNAINLANSLAILEEQRVADEKQVIREQDLHNQRLANSLKIADQQKTDAEQIRRGEATFSAMLGAASAHNKTFFQIQKVYELSKLAMKTPAAIADAFAWGDSWGGPPAGYAMAGITAAAMGTYASQLAGASFGGGTASASTSSVNTNVSTDLPVTSAPPRESETSGGSVQIIINGAVTEDMVRDVIVPVIQDDIRDRDLVLIDGESRQAGELAA